MKAKAYAVKNHLQGGHHSDIIPFDSGIKHLLAQRSNGQWRWRRRATRPAGSRCLTQKLYHNPALDS